MLDKKKGQGQFHIACWFTLFQSKSFFLYNRDWILTVFSGLFSQCALLCAPCEGFFVTYNIFCLFLSFLQYFEEKVFWKILNKVLSELLTSDFLSWLAEKL